MPVPKIQWQQTMLPPKAVHAEVSFTWVRRADHALCTVSIKDRPNGEQLALCTGSVPSPNHGNGFAHALRDVLDDVLNEFHRHVVEQEPF